MMLILCLVLTLVLIHILWTNLGFTNPKLGTHLRYVIIHTHTHTHIHTHTHTYTHTHTHKHTHTHTNTPTHTNTHTII